MNWKIDYLPEALEDLRSLDGSERLLVRKAIAKVSQNPLPKEEGGFGSPLGNKGGRNLTGFLKIKILKAGLRVVYKLVNVNDTMMIIVIGARADDEVYDTAAGRAANLVTRDRARY